MSSLIGPLLIIIMLGYGVWQGNRTVESIRRSSEAGGETIFEGIYKLLTYILVILIVLAMMIATDLSKGYWG